MARLDTGYRAFELSPLALAAALAIAVALPARAQTQFFASSGANNTFPVNLFPIDPAASTLDFGNNTLLVGNSAPGSFAATAGALLRAGALNIANGANGSGSVTVTGAGTRAELGGALLNRLDIGSWGVGSLLVSGGALVDANVNAAACRAPGAFCNGFIGNLAGSTGTLTVTGAGSELRTLRAIGIGQVAVFRQALDGFTFGTPGGTTNAFVNVLAGGTLRTEFASVGSGPNTASALGTERGFGNVLVDGPASRWIVTHNSIDNREAFVVAGNGVGGQGTIDIRNGGRLMIDGSGGIGPFDGINLGVNGGRARMTVSGTGSSVDIAGVNPLIQVGRSGVAAQGSFSVLAGATASALYLNVGRDGASGDLLIDGAGSQLSLIGIGTPGNGGAGSILGGGGGSGRATVSNGGRWLIGDGGGDSRLSGGSPGMTIGRETGSTGKLTITGAGSTVAMLSNSLAPGAGVADNFNVGMTIGRFSGSSGELVIDNGGKLTIQGNAISTVDLPRTTALQIGGSSDTDAGGAGVARVAGLGSEIRVAGSDAFIAVGRGPGATGQLTIADQGVVSGTVMNVGRGGGNGTLTLDAGTLNLAGQFTGPTLSGAALTLGNRNGTGVATVTNGSRVNITNLGSSGASLNLGGTGPNPLGNGTLTLSGASQINVTAASGLATFQVGRDGTGLATVREASAINIGDGSTFIGRLVGSNGTLVLESGSSLNAGYVGVGRNQAGDGGSGRLIVNNSSVTATTVEIGTLGFLGGNDGTINGNVILHGVLSPGESPGRIRINGGLRTGSGQLLLEVASGGSDVPGFAIDQVLLTEGTTFDFTGLEVSFAFLAGADPNAFAAAGGFDLDNFLRSVDPVSGVSTGLSAVFTEGQTWSTVLATAEINARAGNTVLTNFALAPDGAVTFSAAPIPEPSTWALMFMGLVIVSGLARRRHIQARASGASPA